MTGAIRFARTATLIGAGITLLTAFSIDRAPHFLAWIVGGVAVIIALINLWELNSHLGETALKHTELYRRFMAVQEKMAKEPDVWKERLPDWESEVIKIRADEPPIMWAVYAEAWNQVIDRNVLQKKGYYRPVRWWQHQLRNVIQFNPQAFPAVA
jgi:hypothetical protein